MLGSIAVRNSITVLLLLTSTTVTAMPTIIQHSRVTTASSPSSSSDTTAQLIKDPSPSIAHHPDNNAKNQDPYVKASPLSVAAVCSDGVVLLSLHYKTDDDVIAASDDKDELKINTSSSSLQSIEDKMMNDTISSSHGKGELQLSQQTNHPPSNTTKTHSSRWFNDIPLSTRGPLRIEPIYIQASSSIRRSDSSSTTMVSSSSSSLPPSMAMMTAGWRTDGMTLSNIARELIAEERMLYCLPYLTVMSGSDESTSGCDDDAAIVSIDNKDVDGTTTTSTRRIHSKTQPYGRRIAEGLSYYMAKCVFSEGTTRSLSTVGLLTVGSKSIHDRGNIFFIDATGAYRTRCHAIGCGADFINRKMGYVDFTKVNCQDGTRILLEFIGQEIGGELNTATDVKSSNNNNNEQQELRKLWGVSQGAAVEIAFIKNGEERMRRARLAQLYD
eukprot:scaffold17996_cov55-Cyclotella_meneghiniana.AAC.4